MPNNSDVFDTKPTNNDVIDQKPNNVKMSDPMQIYTETRIVSTGQLVTSFPLMIYPTAGTFSNAVRL